MQFNTQQAVDRVPDVEPTGHPGNIYDRIAISSSSRAHLGNNYNTTVHYHSIDDEDDDNDMNDNVLRKRKRRQRFILDHLQYEHMERRRKAISNAHDSYEWAFDPSKTPLRDWLVNAGGIFWVTGKAGAGKSTFMKFLAEHATTRRLLHIWAADRRLVVGTHFFWYASARELHRNFEGFLRSLLLAALCEIPDAIQDIFPVRWSQSEFSRLSEWTEGELLQAVRHLTVVSDVAVVFFIDGLDEFVPSTSTAI
jgi:hypothetical protein